MPKIVLTLEADTPDELVTQLEDHLAYFRRPAPKTPPCAGHEFCDEGPELDIQEADLNDPYTVEDFHRAVAKLGKVQLLGQEDFATRVVHSLIRHLA